MEQNDISSRIVFADRGKVNVEKGVEFAPKFDQNGLIPALAMDHITHEPLMLAYMNAESLRMTMELGEAVYYSRSRQEIWHKGATSGHVQKVKQILVDCDQDALIVLVDQCGAGACHTGHHSCFYRSVPFGDELKAQPQGGPSRCVKRTEASFLMPKPCTARAINSFCASICVRRVDAPSFSAVKS
ncbi:phosphoribosyl-AMP cyclohydrolase [Akkermansia muciniphila]|uniref:phosphoribosyl-AMP cyclohydrolase n=1 Tax=Akkermansia muciniphila TaxID=239935 RepID=UPI00138E6238|nr:phosphoribosyl-AMP cyclohydrolase [Akkermansia muciniphila]QHV15927.1 phosphoribosyl-AMP cyclohydrolase [Akkermansia muciniphila]